MRPPTGRRTGHFFLVAAQRVELAHDANVVHGDLRVAGARREPVAVPVPLAVQHGVLVRVPATRERGTQVPEPGSAAPTATHSTTRHRDAQGRQGLAALGVPQLHEVVAAARGDQRFVRVPVDAPHVVTVAWTASAPTARPRRGGVSDRGGARRRLPRTWRVPRRAISSATEPKSQTLITPSSEQDANLLPVGANLTHRRAASLRHPADGERSCDIRCLPPTSPPCTRGRE